MPVLFSFDLDNYQNNDHSRIQAFFERLGWQHVGGTAYRYPRLGTDDQPVEDWFNHVIPALMLFRSFVRSRNIQVANFTIDVQTSTGYNAGGPFGTPPLAAQGDAPVVTLYDPAHPNFFGKKKLKAWLDGIAYPYPLNAPDEDQPEEDEDDGD
jgi:hypothetical protein